MPAVKVVLRRRVVKVVLCRRAADRVGLVSHQMVRVIALIWTAAALIQAASLALRVRDADWGWPFWLSLLLLAVWVCGAAAYWLVARRQSSPAGARRREEAAQSS
jgi:uncharacterized membrane protein YhaH (DUF805 family)